MDVRTNLLTNLSAEMNKGNKEKCYQLTSTSEYKKSRGCRTPIISMKSLANIHNIGKLLTDPIPIFCKNMVIIVCLSSNSASQMLMHHFLLLGCEFRENI